MLTYTATTGADAARVWRLLAEPAQWHRWAPHIRGGRGLGDPEVQAGSSGTVRLWPALPVPVRITAKQPGHRWDWRVGPVDMAHTVVGRDDGAEIRLEISGAAPLERGIAVTYGPLVKVLLRNLARVAERDR
jgi:uncharacterized protein YndB with AHSA1/START domain